MPKYATFCNTAPSRARHRAVSQEKAHAASYRGKCRAELDGYSFANDPDRICAFQIYGSAETANAFLKTSGYLAYEMEVTPLLEGPPDSDEPWTSARSRSAKRTKFSQLCCPQSRGHRRLRRGPIARMKDAVFPGLVSPPTQGWARPAISYFSGLLERNRVNRSALTR